MRGLGLQSLPSTREAEVVTSWEEGCEDARTLLPLCDEDGSECGLYSCRRSSARGAAGLPGRRAPLHSHGAGVSATLVEAASVVATGHPARLHLPLQPASRSQTASSAPSSRPLGPPPHLSPGRNLKRWFP
jgi:hypothetical protein